MSTEWNNWAEVTKFVPTNRRLFRSSAPNYTGGDSSQNLTSTAVDFLKSKGIKGVISFNQISYTTAQITLLSAAGIAYKHLPVVDYTAPTLKQLEDANTFFLSASNTSVLVHCGFGYGRTGTGVTGLQLYATQGANPPETDWQTVNHVEKPEQMQVLRDLRDKLKPK